MTLTLLIGLLVSAHGSSIPKADRTLHIVHIIPGNATNYTAAKELRDIEKSTRAAIQQFKAEYPQCRFSEEHVIQRGSENDLFEKVSEIAKAPGRRVAVGFSRSGLARLAARAAQGSSLVGVSIGASADDLQSINPNFVSMASSWREQWRELRSRLSQEKCDAGSSLVVGDTKDSYSFNFRCAA